MSNDITDLLREWEFDPEDNARIITADDGRKVLQVRQPLGVEQYELDGRPDGARVDEHETVTDAIDARVDRHRAEHGSEEGFELSHEECVSMQNEGILFYYRYLLLFQLGDFERVARDTEHNLHICELLIRHCTDKEDREAVLQFRPYILRMNAVSRAMTYMKANEHETARSVIEEAITTIQEMEEIDTPAFQFERVRSINYLRQSLEQVSESEPDAIARLSAQLKDAVENEDYERAAALRDRIRDLS